MQDFLQMVDVEYGSVTEYAKKVHELEEHDLDVIRRNLKPEPMVLLSTVKECRVAHHENMSRIH